MGRIASKGCWALVLLALVGCQGGEPEDDGSGIRIGLLVPLTGVFASEPSPAARAAQLAVDEINAAGGVLGQKLRLKVADDASDPELAAKAARQLIADGAVALVGPSTSGGALAVSDDATTQSTAMVSYAASSPALTVNNSGRFFRTVPSDAYQGVAAADYAHQGLPFLVKTAAVLYVDDAYGTGLAHAFKQQFEQLGGQVTAMVKYPLMDRDTLGKYDFSNDAIELFKAHPELVFLVTYIHDGAKFTQEALGHLSRYSPLKFLGCGTNRFSAFVGAAAAPLVEGLVGIASAAPEGDAAYKLFAASYKARFGAEPEQFSAGAYDAVYLLAYAMERAGQANRAAIPKQLAELSGPPGTKIGVAKWSQGVAELKRAGDIDYEGASGSIDWDANGELTSGYFEIWQVQNGSFVRLSVIPFAQ